MTYYRKSGYRIETIQSTDYHGFGNPQTVWTPVRRTGGCAAPTANNYSTGLVPRGNQEEISGKCFIQIDQSEFDKDDQYA